VRYGIASKSELLVDVLGTICDAMSCDLFSSIVEEANGTMNLRPRSEMTRKQYYSRMSKLVNAKLVMKVGSKYKPTYLGKVIYELLLRLETAANNRLKLMAFDKIYSTNTVPVNERSRVMGDILNDRGKHEIMK
jgi:hypothetical protein